MDQKLQDWFTENMPDDKMLWKEVYREEVKGMIKKLLESFIEIIDKELEDRGLYDTSFDPSFDIINFKEIIEKVQSKLEKKETEDNTPVNETLKKGEYYYLFYKNHDNDFLRLYDVLSDVLHIEGCKREIKRKAVHPENIKFTIIKGSQINIYHEDNNIRQNKS